MHVMSMDSLVIVYMYIYIYIYIYIYLHISPRITHVVYVNSMSFMIISYYASVYIIHKLYYTHAIFIR